MVQKHGYELSVVLICENGKWIAQCLDYDITAQGSNIEKAIDSFTKTFAGQVFIDIKSGKQPLEDFTKAPIEYWDMFKQARRLEGKEAFELPQSVMPGAIGLAQMAAFA